MHICERGNIIYANYVKEEIETKRDNKTKQDKAVKARDVSNLIYSRRLTHGSNTSQWLTGCKGVASG
jgi:hypothetical protein